MLFLLREAIHVFNKEMKQNYFGVLFQWSDDKFVRCV